MSNIASLRTPLTIAQDSIVAGLETILAEAKDGKIEGVLVFAFGKDDGFDVFQITPGVSDPELIGVLEYHKLQVAFADAVEGE